MKQILLVDDDFLSLNAFYGLADWGAHGLCIAMEAHNGREAADYLSSNGHEIDAAFIDVCMPNMDGISLLQVIRERYPHIQCFMLSNYSDYPYVREALKLGAIDYLLKYEITPENLLRLLSQQGLCGAPEENAENRLHRLMRILAGGEGDLAPGWLCCGKYQGERMLVDAQQRSILQTCRHVLNETGILACAPRMGELALYLEAKEGYDHRRENPAVCDACDKVEKALAKYCNLAYAFSAPHFCVSASEIVSSYRLLAKPQDASSFFSGRSNAMLLLACMNGQKQLAEQTLHTIFSQPGAEAQSTALQAQLLALLNQARQALSLPLVGQEAPRVSFRQAEQFFIDQFSLLCGSSPLAASHRCSPMIQLAVAYLEKHYAEDIHLTDVAAHCHVSYSHLSYLFKQETGNNIVNYLNRLRIFHAAHLLLFDNASVTNVYQQVGFNGYNHFVATFKAVTGTTPSEFRKSPHSGQWMLQFNPAALIS